MITMGVRANGSATLVLGDRWVLTATVRDDDGQLVDGAPSVVVTPPAGPTSTPEVERVSVGAYRAGYVPTASGRFVARVAAVGYGSADVAVYVIGATTDTGMPTVDDVATYLREGAASWDTDDLQDALDAEAAAQRGVCRVRAVYPADLRQALLRRVQRNLAMRQLPLAVLQGDADSGGTVLPGRDPEVRRLEAPHRRLTVG